MTECLCPKCGYVWDHDGVAPTAEMKAAVLSHLAGGAPSVLDALMKARHPQLEIKRARVQSFCDPADLERFRKTALLKTIKKGEIYCWEPDSLWCADLVQVLRIEDRKNGDCFVWTTSPNDVREIFNDYSRCQEAFVKSTLKALPDRL